MKERFYKLDTDSGKTTLNMAQVSAYTVKVIEKGILKKNTFAVEIHLKSGTIFVTHMDEAQLTIWEDVFFPKAVVKE